MGSPSWYREPCLLLPLQKQRKWKGYIWCDYCVFPLGSVRDTSDIPRSCGDTTKSWFGMSYVYLLIDLQTPKPHSFASLFHFPKIPILHPYSPMIGDLSLIETITLVLRIYEFTVRWQFSVRISRSGSLTPKKSDVNWSLYSILDKMKKVGES